MKVNVNGQEVEATQTGFVSMSEPFAEYHLEDERILRVKTVVTKVFRTELKGSDGLPIYSIQSSLVMVVDEKT